MREKLTSALGSFGMILYYLIRIVVAVLPIVMIGGSFAFRTLLVAVMYCIPATGVIFWVWGLVCAVKGVQDAYAIVYYICFAVLFPPTFIDAIRSLTARK